MKDNQALQDRGQRIVGTSFGVMRRSAQHTICAVTIVLLTLLAIAVSGCSNDEPPESTNPPSGGGIEPTPIPVAFDFFLRSGAINEPLALRAASTGRDDDTYAWKLVSTPASAIATLSDPDGLTTTIEADVPGCYRVGLTVTSGEQQSDVLIATLELGTRLPEIIDQDTTLNAAASPYYLEATTIAPGVTLEIPPSITLVGPVTDGFDAAGTLSVAGALRAQGTPTSPVLFRHLAIIGAESTDQPDEATVELSAVVMGTRSELFRLAPPGFVSRTIISNSLLEMELDSIGSGDKGDINFTGFGDVTFTGNIFTGVTWFLLNTSRPGTHIEFSENWFIGPVLYFSEDRYYSDGSNVTVLNRNNIEVGEIALIPGAENASIDATNNWWGTISISEIEERIFDQSDDALINKYVTYEPTLQAPNPDAPDSARLAVFREALNGRLCQ